MPMIKSQILNSVDFEKTQKTKYLENKALPFLQIKNVLIVQLDHCMAKNCFAVEVTFKGLN